MTLKTRMQAVTDRLIPPYGFKSVLRRTLGGGIDPVTGVDTSVTTELPVWAIVREIKFSQIDGTLIQAGDRMYTLTHSVEPTNGDKFRVGAPGSDYLSVVWVSPAQVQDGNVSYKILVRG